jgi:hypothetical protein
MRIHPTPDPDLRAFSLAPNTMIAWLRHAESLPMLSLDGTWRDLDAILGEAPSSPSPSPLSPGGADISFAEISEVRAHGIFSGSTEELLKALGEVDRRDVEGYLRQRWGADHSDGADGGDTPPLGVITEDLLLALGRLKETLTVAVAKGFGLLMVL